MSDRLRAKELTTPRAACAGEAVALDASGKAVMSHLYDQTDPRAYYQTLGALDYRIPESAQHPLQAVIAALRERRQRRHLKLVDMGCSYGILGRMLRLDASMADTIEHYVRRHAGSSRAALIASDQALLEAARRAGKDPGLDIVGLDIAANACAYATASGAVDAAIIANLEDEVVPNSRLDAMAGADLVVSTGFIGYGGVRSVMRTLDACGDSRPWMVHFVMRIFDYRPIRMALAERGYVTRRLDGTFVQRRFASRKEHAEIVGRLLDAGIDPCGREDDGLIHAECFLSRPAEDRFASGAHGNGELAGLCK